MGAYGVSIGYVYGIYGASVQTKIKPPFRMALFAILQVRFQF